MTKRPLLEEQRAFVAWGKAQLTVHMQTFASFIEIFGDFPKIFS